MTGSPLSFGLGWIGELIHERMRLVILNNYDLASEWAAKYICNRIIQFKPNENRYFTLGLPTGNILPPLLLSAGEGELGTSCSSSVALSLGGSELLPGLSGK